MEVKGKPLVDNMTYALALHLSLYNYPFITGFKCSYCKGLKSLHFTNSPAYANIAELWKHVVTRHNYEKDEEHFRPTTEIAINPPAMDPSSYLWLRGPCTGASLE